jgi:hypothetical protein
LYTIERWHVFNLIGQNCLTVAQGRTVFSQFTEYEVLLESSGTVIVVTASVKEDEK